MGHVALVSLGVLLMLAFGTSTAMAEDSLHTFDPQLSLTGGCTTSTLDPIQDPSCPAPLPPSGSFTSPTSVVTDSYGNIYVASFGQNLEGFQGRIDIFDSEGFFITEILDEAGPSSLAVDSNGVLYVANSLASFIEERIVRYEPTGTYEPATGEIAYGDPTVILNKNPDVYIGLAVNPLNNHLFANLGDRVADFGTATEGNPELDEDYGDIEDATGSGATGVGLAIDGARNRIYVSNEPDAVKVFELAAPNHPVLTIDGSNTPAGEFVSSYLSVAVDEGTGNIFVYDGEGHKVYEFAEDGSYLATIEHGFDYVAGAEISVDNGSQSPHGALAPQAPEGRYLFVPSHRSGVGHAFAFGPSGECEPVVEPGSASVADAGETEAVLQAEVEPCGLNTSYRFEYVTEQQFEEAGFAGAALAGSGSIAAGAAPVQVSAAASGLLPGTNYRFRIVATNAKGSDEEVGSFGTYPSNLLPTCGNESLRTGAAALLPDCRAYELVTPAETNGRSPRGIGGFGARFSQSENSPAGDALSFDIEGGVIPGYQATGYLSGDPYLSTRTSAGWTTVYTGPTPAQATGIEPGSSSPDQGYLFWTTATKSGSALVEGKTTSYVRYPDGHFELVGRGSLGVDPEATGRLISENGGHIIFSISNQETGHLGPAVQLEPAAPPQIEVEENGKTVIKGTAAVYDRTSDEVTHVVSLLPGNQTPQPGQNAKYIGASLDGRGVAFAIGTTLYLRYDNTETYKVGENVKFAGIAEGGDRIFYVKEGKLEAFDVDDGRIAFNASGTAIPVNVSADGSTAYLVSTTVLTKEPNPLGAKAKAGQQNLFRSQEGTISFVGTVTPGDVEGDLSGNYPVDGLGLWTEAVANGWGASDPSRTTPNGGVLLFESRANLTGYDPEGHPEVFRYDFGGEKLACLSCLPTRGKASGEASLQSIAQEPGAEEPFTPYALVHNLRADGRRAFFQSSEPLVPRDTDGLQDVYEWEDQGVGSCSREGGCIYLISSGHSARKDFLYGVSDSGDDVFFKTADVLLGVDREQTPSIYDARVEGGFPEPVEAECQGEGCQLPLATPPSLTTPQTSPSSDGKAARKCPKGKRKVKRHGKVRCVKRRHNHHKHHHKAGSKKKGAGK